MHSVCLLIELFKSFNAAINSAIRTDSRDTTDEYVVVAGGSVTCPPATYRALRRKFSPNFHIKYHVTFDFLKSGW